MIIIITEGKGGTESGSISVVGGLVNSGTGVSGNISLHSGYGIDAVRGGEMVDLQYKVVEDLYYLLVGRANICHSW
jgi:hypothetical protein